MMNTEHTVNVLNQLIEVCKDGEKGYRGAANEIQNGHRQVLFEAYARQRSEFGSALESEVRRLGGDPFHTGTATGSLHRGWMHLRSILNRKHDDLIVRECYRGENIASMNYKEALEEELPPYLRSILARQLLGVLEARNRVNQMLPAAKERKT
jgi:uncharacterized protein (TIGR02284 family)